MKILFVCTGNTNRSCYAECVLRQMAQEMGRQDVEVQSKYYRI